MVILHIKDKGQWLDGRKAINIHLGLFHLVPSLASAPCRVALGRMLWWVSSAFPVAQGSRGGGGGLA